MVPCNGLLCVCVGIQLWLCGFCVKWEQSARKYLLQLFCSNCFKLSLFQHPDIFLPKTIARSCSAFFLSLIRDLNALTVAFARSKTHYFSVLTTAPSTIRNAFTSNHSVQIYTAYLIILNFFSQKCGFIFIFQPSNNLQRRAIYWAAFRKSLHKTLRLFKKLD